MTMVWHKNIPAEDQQKILRKIEEIETTHFASYEEFEEIVDEQGAFSRIFFVGDYALKHTSFWEDEHVEFEGASVEYEGYTLEPFDLLVQSDADILLQVGHLPSCVDFIGHGGDWVVLEKLKGRSVQDIQLLENPRFQLNESQLHALTVFVEACLHKGIVPIDINEGSIFPVNDEQIKIIDFNLYQTMAYIEAMGAQFNPEQLPYTQVAKAIVSASPIVRKK